MTTEVKRRGLALSEGAAAGLLFGTAAIFIRTIPCLDPYTTAFWRLMIASIALVLIAKVMGQAYRFFETRQHLPRISILGTLIGVHFTLFISSVRETSILNATVLVNTSPIMAMVISALIYGVRPRRIPLIGLFVSLLGVTVIGAGDLFPLHKGKLLGDVEAIIASIAEAFYLNIGLEIRNKMNLFTIMIPVFAIAAISVSAFSYTAGFHPLVPIELGIILPLLGLGLLPTALGHSLYF